MLKPSAVNTKKESNGLAANVGYVRPEVTAAKKIWCKINDCVNGEDAVKEQRTKYLPIPDAEVGGKETDARYLNYILRAVFYNVTGRTLTGLVGQVFGRETVVAFPTELEDLAEDLAGDGVSITQQAKKGLEYVLSLGRAGLLADFPVTEGPVTKLDAEEGGIRPIIQLYRPEQIINWRVLKKGAKKKLSLVVLLEEVDDDDDGFEIKTSVAYRVLRLEKGIYTSQLYIEEEGTLVAKPKLTPTDASKKPFTFIPFTFMGPENNDPTIDAAPLHAMSVLNIAHYRNSADFEDACFIAGQPTPVFSGLTEEWVTKVMTGKVYLGARGGVMLPKGGTATLLQATNNPMPKEAMEHKEHQMVALGAKLVEDRSIRRTATEAKQDEASETSILSSSTKNVNDAYNQALLWTQMFVSGDGEIVFTLNSDFDLSSMTPSERQQLVQEWQAEAITWLELRTALKRGRIAFEDDEKAKTNIAENPPITVEDPPVSGDAPLDGGANGGGASA